MRDEDRLAVLSFGRTLAFLAYSLVVVFITMAAVLLTPIGGLPDTTRDWVGLAIFVVLELILLALVVRGALPATNPTVVQPVSEKLLATMFTVASAGAWLFTPDQTEAEILQSVFNGFLLLAVAVYFVTKSVLSRRLRLNVLLVGILPALQLYIAAG